MMIKSQFIRRIVLNIEVYLGCYTLYIVARAVCVSVWLQLCSSSAYTFAKRVGSVKLQFGFKSTSYSLL